MPQTNYCVCDPHFENRWSIEQVQRENPPTHILDCSVTVLVLGWSSIYSNDAPDETNPCCDRIAVFLGRSSIYIARPFNRKPTEKQSKMSNAMA